ncbi:MAG TPA: squalene/phytoene synthase family protein [Myxococcaceae bacterium]|nr:squalene/phytoene synthase family protein [Myxococcaceae bacterium]
MTLLELLRLSSRTFALGIERLPRPLYPPVMVAYLLLRVSDYLEDTEDLRTEEKVALLELWDAVLAGQAEPSRLLGRLPPTRGDHPDSTVAAHLVEVVEALRALPPGAREPITAHVRDSTRGMARWAARGPRVRDEADMDDYMHEVAGRVGFLLTDLFAWHSGAIREKRDALMPLARDFGLALQTVNVIRGLREDFQRGWIFVPETFCEQVHLRREEVFLPEHREEAMKVLDLLVAKAERHLHAAETYLKAIPRRLHRIRLFCLFPLLFAVRTLAISRHDHRVLDSEAKISRDEVRRIVRDSTLFGWSNGWIERYARALRVVG